ncbi:hypothetical protein [Reyranella sp.]|uniref:hypothetical protein n=1 Tax=Reyranella sp. TaxID=1929291 RepID=UPI00272EEEBD|nr:hypothetical protein [Reyranella sp.]MDP2376559.1 hypothetical protein [Reyranella sp.]
MIAALRWLAALPAAFGRWLAFRRLITSGLAGRVLDRNPDTARRRQALAARRAFLADLTPHQRTLTRLPYGDIH